MRYQEIHGKLRQFSNNSPTYVLEDISKGRYKPEGNGRKPRSFFENPLAIQHAMGYKDRYYSLSYDVLKRIPQQLSLVAAILQTRCTQVSTFCVPHRVSKTVGFSIKHKDPTKKVTKSELEFIQSLETFILNCGAPRQGIVSSEKRDDFETFLKKITRDSLMYDQACFEVVPDLKGDPFEFVAVDASTIRIAGPNILQSVDSDWFNMDEKGKYQPFRTLVTNASTDSRIAYCQVVNGQIRNVYTADEMVFGIRNPRTDIQVSGYGYAELEQLITTITSHLYAEQFNQKFFSNGSNVKGILNLKGDSFSEDQLEGFKRMWEANLSGINGAWKTPIFQVEQGLDFINLSPNNRDLEFSQYLEYLIKLCSAVFLIDPSELNFDLKGGVTQTPLFESSAEWKIKASRDKGLVPLLKFLAKLISKNIVEKIAPDYVFEFSGLNDLTEQEKHELKKSQLSSYMTLNEIRTSEDLPEIEGGDVVLNPTYLQALQLKQQQEASTGTGADPETQVYTQDKQVEENKSPIMYSDGYQKALKHEQECEVDDSWIDLLKSV